jgi:hypothetical protein
MADFLILDDDKKNITDNDVNNRNKPILKGNFMDVLNNYIVSLQSIKTKEKVIFYRLLSTMTNA